MYFCTFRLIEITQLPDRASAIPTRCCAVKLKLHVELSPPQTPQLSRSFPENGFKSQPRQKQPGLSNRTYLPSQVSSSCEAQTRHRLTRPK